MERRIEAEWNEKTVKSYLYGALSLSTRMIAALKRRENGICLNGQRVTVRALLHTNDILTIAEQDADETAASFPATDIPLHILYEDADILAVNKAQGMPCHPSRGHYDDTLANAVTAYYQDTPFVFRAANRLDSDTSGIVLIAKHRLAAYRLGEQMKARTVQKEYLAILQGALPGDGATIDAPIRRKENSSILREVATSLSEDAQSAQTAYRVLWKTDTLCGVLAMPITGRTHQLRVHFAAQGAPILYDPFYGTEKKGAYLRLHAWRLTFVHPMTQQQMTLCAPMPQAMQQDWEKGEAYVENI